jgi:hypothetical protein
LHRRVNELDIEITDSLRAYKRSKEDIIKSVLDVYKNVIQTKNANKHRNSIYNVCPTLDSNKYLYSAQALHNIAIINKYMNPYIEQTAYIDSSLSDIDPPSLFASIVDDQIVFDWFTNFNDRSNNERIIHFVFTELLAHIKDRLDLSPLHLTYSDPKMVDELMGMIDDELRQVKLDMAHINRPSFIRDLVILMLYMFVEKTNQRFERKNKELLREALDDLTQVKHNLLYQMKDEEHAGNHAKMFRRILGKEIIREVERINRQNFIQEIRTKINEHRLIDPTDITRFTYAESIDSKPIDPAAILKIIFDPNHYCLEKVHRIVKDMSQPFIQIYSDDINTTVTTCMLIMTDVVLNSECSDAHVLHKEVLEQVSDRLYTHQYAA